MGSIGKCFWPSCPNPAESGEHLFTDWLNRVLPSGVDWTFVETSYGTVVDRGTSRRPATRKFKVVCATCNTEWMSRLTDATKAVVEPMVLGQATKLPMENQLTIASWIAMKAYVWEEHTGTRASTDEDREILFRELRPSGNTRVRIAAYHNPGRLEASFTYFPAFGDPPYYRDARGYVCTVTLGALIIQALGRPDSKYRPFEQVGVTRDVSVEIWPPIINGAQWPPRVVLSPTTREDFATEPFPQFREQRGG